MGFRTTLRLNGKTATGIEVPEAVVEGLGNGRRPPVVVTVNGHTYRSSIAVMDGRFMVPVSAEIREVTGVAAGDEIEVEIVLDTEPREVTVPDDLATALRADAAAQRFFDGLSYSKRRRIVLAIEGAKKAETRQRRVTQSVAALHEGREP